MDEQAKAPETATPPAVWQADPTALNPVSLAIGQMQVRIEFLERGQASVVEDIKQIRGHLDQQDNAISALDTKVEGVQGQVRSIDSKMDGGFQKINERFDGLDGPLAQVIGMASTIQERTIRRVQYWKLFDTTCSRLQYLVGVLWLGLSAFSLTHPIGPLPDLQVAPEWIALTVIGILLVSRTVYAKLHHPDDDPPDGGTPQPEPEHHHHNP